MAMASPYLLLRLAADEIFQTLEPSSSALATPTHTATTSSSCYDAFVPVFRPDPTPASPALSVSAADRVRSQFLSVERDLFHDALVAPRNDGLGFPEDDDDDANSSASIPWDCLQFDDESEPDLPPYPPAPADEFDWEEVAPAPTPGPAAEPEWEVLVATPPSDEGFVYTSHRDAHDVLVAGGEALFLTSKPPASTSAVRALPSAVVAPGDDGEECAVCKDGVAAGERVKRMPCSHRYHEGCIVPWLQVRNSCPLCRFELPTDDPRYEAWKAGRAVAAR
ncbi:hypothetical protein QYE76_030986 [Lolium multiflorum]|uniref:RING-type E3 ubiquitin transferase n=1 Tax=Lolium multiflorum TaxID=4521 RepID=A0AAD8QQS1_LOLMU|nr:hypothetical protein QYE76_030986 [Lolium multiflorum]